MRFIIGIFIVLIVVFSTQANITRPPYIPPAMGFRYREYRSDLPYDYVRVELVGEAILIGGPHLTGTGHLCDDGFYCVEWCRTHRKEVVYESVLRLHHDMSLVGQWGSVGHVRHPEEYRFLGVCE